MEGSNIPSENELMLLCFFNILKEDGYLEKTSTSVFKMIRQFPCSDERAKVHMRGKEMMDKSVDVKLLVLCMERLAGVLQGQESVLPVLYSVQYESSFKNMYDDLIGSRIQHQMLTAITKAMVEKRWKGTKIRILEVGAGTGSVGAVVLPLLDDAGISYSYTYTGMLKSSGFESCIAF